MKRQSVPSTLESLWRQGFFKEERTFNDIKTKISDLGSNPSSQNLNNALKRIRFLSKRGKPGHQRYIQKNAAHTIMISGSILPDELISKLESKFKTEITDLNHNFGVSGNCSAFLLRKILEKLIFLVFTKNGQGSKLQESSGRLVGLQTMLNLAITIKVNGKPFLTKKTADRIQPIKFLGDTAAHNPMINVSMRSIEREMAYIVTAFSELSSWL
jgi:hypothetical protein